MRAALGRASLATWVGLATLRGGFWRTSERLPDAAAASGATVVAVVPARDEQDVVGDTVARLVAEPAVAAVVVVDDDSADATSVEASAAGAEVIRASPVPPGWVGKPWALAHGIDAAATARHPDYYLLVDADVRLGPGTAGRLVALAERDGTALASVMATLDTTSPWARLLVPAFVYYFGLLYPFRLVNRPGSRTAAAAGGCMLVRRASLERAGGIAAIAAALIDDVALASAIKRAGGRLWLGLDPDVVSARRYRGLGDVWEMVSRSAYVQLRHSPVLLAATVAGMLLLFAAPLAGGPSGAAAYAVMTATYAPTVRFYRLPCAIALTLPLAGVLYTAMTLDSALRHRLRRGTVWKRRTYGPGSNARAGTGRRASPRCRGSR